MRSNRAKKWLIIVAAYLSLLALLFIPQGLLYSLPLLLAAIFYDKSRLAFWASLILATPYVLGVAAQFAIRTYLLIAHGGEAPDGGGSPMAFLFGFAMEMPFYILLAFLLTAWFRDFRRRRSPGREVESGNIRADTPG
jgi:hypothetical protein